ncbi:uncharacterized protein G2W53_041556 [Senna tora]|uniref:Uncharacterized protein n=1 Tax=Senna tora TaxID=362788 RepID=A0A834VZA1_9FABA|nr:uncharacterized protein G2W53_041556 [Senna tora]
MASTAIVKRKGSDTSSAIAKRPKLFLDNSAKECFESDFKSKGIWEGEPMGHSMIRGKKVELTADNIRSWKGVKKGDFERYSSREPITMESYSIEKAAKKLGGSSNGWEPDLAFIILNHMKDTLVRPTADLPYGSLITLIARARGVGGKWIKQGKAKDEPREGTEKRKMNVKHGRRPPKSTKGSGTRKSSRLLKQDTSSPSSPI